MLKKKRILIFCIIKLGKKTKERPSAIELVCVCVSGEVRGPEAPAAGLLREEPLLPLPPGRRRAAAGWTGERGRTCVSALRSTGSVLTRTPPLFRQAFLGVCDILTAHSYQLQVWDPASFGPLLYTPSPKLQRALLAFVCAHVFVGADGYSQCSGET